MRELEKFKIDIFKLGNGIHTYEFTINKSFFQESPEGSIEEGKGTVNIELEKNDSFLNVDFKFDVKIELECDRSLETFEFDIKKQENLIFKFGEEDVELDDNIVMIHRDTQRLNLTHYMYEFMLVAIPMKKLHPKYGDDFGEDELVYSSSEEKPQTELDPRWEQLKKLK